MIALGDMIGAELIHRLGWGLVHFLWQGVAVGLVLAVALLVLRRRSANLRYLMACGALLAMAAGPVLTAMLVDVPQPAEIAPVEVTQTVIESPPAPPVAFVPLPRPAESVEPVAAGPVVLEPPAPPPAEPAGAEAPWHETAAEALGAHLDWIVLAWAIGAGALSLWHLGGWMQLRRLRRLSTPAGAELRRQLTDLAEQLRVSRPVRLLSSAAVKVPAAMGLLRPVILLPVTAVTGLSEQQLAAVLAHELAHIRRWDYLVNLLQMVIETALFYHPAVWWVSRRVRAERENCCDDLAITACRDRTTYARALAALVELRGQPRLAVAAGGGKLLARIRRIVSPTDTAPAHHAGGGQARRATWLAGAIIAVAITAAAVFYGCGDNPDSEPGTAATSQEAATQPADDPATQPSPPAPLPAGALQARLPGGGRVALLGVSEHVFHEPKPDRKWWRPNGTAFQPGLYDYVTCRHAWGGTNAKHVLLRELALRYDGVSKDAGVILKVRTEYTSASLDTPIRGRQDVSDIEVLYVCLKGQPETVDFGIGVATGPWEVFTKRRGTSHYHRGHAYVSAPVEQAGDSYVTGSDMHLDQQCRIVAVDKVGELHVGVSVGGGSSRQGRDGKGLRQTSARFDKLPAKEVHEVRLELRPYKWIEFRNISLQPGRESTPTVKVLSEANATTAPCATQPAATQPAGATDREVKFRRAAAGEFAALAAAALETIKSAAKLTGRKAPPPGGNGGPPRR